ncbi:enoyl-CoA hydratase/isomerase family protein [Arthrobacter sp. NPDC080031]|uniref:enoyl-CoA hydratase/isomerase family protein n=1 Tax=Arthrobacter sp. NPDC080031 TaxID=3155918 RepID=UPI0034508268
MALIDVHRAGDVIRIGINRPGKHNAIDAELVAELAAVLDSLRHEPSILVIHSTTPGIFVAGADIAQLRDRRSNDALEGINAHLFDRIAAHRWPVIAAVDGPAIGGGCELALACDFRVASKRARFAQPEPQLGILAGAGANWRLAQVVGLQTARRMLLAGEQLDAEQALASGLVDELAIPEEVLDAAGALASRMLRSSWQALEFTKSALRLAGGEGTLRFDLAAQAVLFESEEKDQRMDRFLARRKEKK